VSTTPPRSDVPGSEALVPIKTGRREASARVAWQAAR
jgi:hypothetical protein